MDRISLDIIENVAYVAAKHQDEHDLFMDIAYILFKLRRGYVDEALALSESLLPKDGQ